MHRGQIRAPHVLAADAAISFLVAEQQPRSKRARERARRDFDELRHRFLLMARLLPRALVAAAATVEPANLGAARRANGGAR